MKIFGWVHRHFLHKSVKKDDSNDKVALLENEAFAGACDGWNEGILAIGTLGADLFQDFKAKEAVFMCNQALFLDNGDNGDDDDDDEDMECPLVQKVCNPGFGHEEDDVAKPNNHQEDVVVKDSSKVKKSGERITLADLLRADSESDLFKNNKLSYDHKIKVYNNSNSNSNSNNNNNTESIKSFLVSKAKKKLGKDGLAQQVKRTKQLMRKMLRKKIHPHIGIQKESPTMDVHAT